MELELIKCDRCKRSFEGVQLDTDSRSAPASNASYIFAYPYGYTAWDKKRPSPWTNEPTYRCVLCEACVGELREWVASGKTGGATQ